MPGYDLWSDDPSRFLREISGETGSFHAAFGETLEEARAASLLAQRPDAFDLVVNLLADIMAKQAMGETVIQGSLAYLHPDALPTRVKRFIPVDIYTDSPGRTKDLDEAVAYLRILFRVLGFRLAVHPGVALSSVHRRAAIETAPVTAEELTLVEGHLAAFLKNFEKISEVGEADKESRADDLELRKTIAELLKLQAETEKTRAETEKIQAEKAKIRAERVSAVVEAFNKLGSALLKIAAGVSIVIGTTVVASSKAETPGQGHVIQVQRTTKKDNIRRLGEFLEKLGAQATEGEKTAGAGE